MFQLIIFGLVALGFSFLCSIAEAALLSATPAYITLLEQKGKRSGKLLRKLKGDIDQPLAAILSLNTIAHTVGATGVGVQSAVVFGSASLGIVSTVLTLLILILSEIIPKTLGVVYWRSLSPLVAKIVRIMIWLMYPLVLLSGRLTTLLSKGCRSGIFCREEFIAMARLGVKEGQLDTRESHILRNLFRFPTLCVKDIMTPRTVLFTLKDNMSIGQALEEKPDITFSRIPIYKDNHDNITGYVLKSDILLAQARGQHDALLHAYKKEIRSVPETASLSSLFESVLDKREQILLVLDEYGGLQGIVTLEDLVETLLGLEIVDEMDKTTDMQALARAQWEKRAKQIGLLTDEFPRDSNTE